MGLPDFLGAVVGMVAVDAPGAVERFSHDDAHQRVRQGEFAERPAFVGKRADFRSDTFWPTDNEGELAVIFLPVLQTRGEAGAAVLAPRDVEGDDVVTRLQGAANLRCFFVLCGRELAGICAFLQRDFGETETEVASKARSVVGITAINPVRHFLPDSDDFDVHRDSD